MNVRQEAIKKFMDTSREKAAGSNGGLRSMRKEMHVGNFEDFSIVRDGTRASTEEVVAFRAENAIGCMKNLHVLEGIYADCVAVQDKIRIGALVTLKEVDTNKKVVRLVIPGGNGVKVQLSDGREVTCISPESPLAQKLEGGEVGEDLFLDGRGGIDGRGYEIVGVE